MAVRYFHGTNSPEKLLAALTGYQQIRLPFHLTPDLTVARNYGETVVAIDLETDLDDIHVGLINKDGNTNTAVGCGVEVVLRTPRALNSLYRGLLDAAPL